jgi:hypothetical protein
MRAAAVIPPPRTGFRHNPEPLSRRHPGSLRCESRLQCAAQPKDWSSAWKTSRQPCSALRARGHPRSIHLQPASRLQFIARSAIALIEVLHPYPIPPGLAIVVESGRASLPTALDRLAPGSAFPRHYVPDRIALERHRFGFEPAGIVAHPALRIRNSGLAQEPARNRVTPHLRLSRLVFELRQHFTVALLIDKTRQRLPLRITVMPEWSLCVYGT